MEKRLPHSFCNCVSMDYYVTTRLRLPRPRWISSVANTDVSSVLPRPAESAIRMRARGWRSACKVGSSWQGKLDAFKGQIVRWLDGGP